MKVENHAYIINLIFILTERTKDETPDNGENIKRNAVYKQKQLKLHEFVKKPKWQNLILK